MNLPEQKKTETVVDEQDNVIAVLDFIDDIQFRIKLLETGYQGGYYYVNEHGGKSEIDKFGCCKHYYPFKYVSGLFRDVITLQCNLRKEELNQKETCPACFGAGVDTDDDLGKGETCLVCGGTGKV